jgi:branched-chain amino acid transport system permease protein
LFIFTVTLVIMAFLQWFITRTMMGKAMLAASQDFEMVTLMGVEVEQLVMLTFWVSGLLGGAAGVLVGVLYAIDPMMGSMAGLKGWAVAVIGGVGSISGAMIAGLLLGVVENIASGYISSGYRDAIAFVAMVLTLVVKPTGLMGFKFEEKV